MKQIKDYTPNQGYFISFHPETFFNKSSLEWTVHKIIEDNIDINQFSKKMKNQNKGQKEYSPKLLLKIIFYSYCIGVFSSHKMEVLMKKNISYIFLSDNNIIDHSTICRFIIKYSDEIKNVFSKVLYVCWKLGLVNLDMIAVDGTKIKANASNYFTGNKKQFEDLKKRLKKRIEKLQLSNIFKKNKEIIHTSSDGQKYNIAVDSLNANYSFKYFGKGKGVTVYSFIDETHKLFYSTVISSSEREAAYVIDGLLNNDVVQSNIHSTDTHGYSEIIFGVSHLLGISFAPRIKNYKDQRLYSFKSKSYFKKNNYKILPYKKINLKVLKDNWDNILQLITTIKLKETTASGLFRRLSSYSRQHPLYQAIKEFGKIIKTIFLLKYIDDVELRQIIEKQLNKLESANKFAKAVFYGNNQEFQQSTKEEQLITEGCKRLIENAIICWNYLYVSQLIHNAENEKDKRTIIQTVSNSSIVTWQHINLQGEYNFSDDILKDSMQFSFPEILKINV